MARSFAGDPYAVLQVGRDATAKDLKKARARLAKLHHPDVASNEDAAAMMAQINDAYDFLTDASLRSTWDRQHPPPGRA